MSGTDVLPSKNSPAIDAIPCGGDPTANAVATRGNADEFNLDLPVMAPSFGFDQFTWYEDVLYPLDAPEWRCAGQARFVDPSLEDRSDLARLVWSQIERLTGEADPDLDNAGAVAVYQADFSCCWRKETFVVACGNRGCKTFHADPARGSYVWDISQLSWRDEQSILSDVGQEPLFAPVQCLTCKPPNELSFARRQWFCEIDRVD